MTFVTQRDGQPLFRTTHWSLVGRAVEEGDASLETLCQQYWQPVYAMVRREGHDIETAKDLTQGFFAKLLQNDWLKVADQEKGRFRTFLMTLLRRYLVDEWRKETAAKRGGRNEVLHLDEKFINQLEVTHLPPDAVFDRHWALALLETALAHLEKETGPDFSLLKDCLTAQRGETDYAELGQKLSLQEGAVRVAVHRLRKRYRLIIRQEIARTVGKEDEVQDEMEILMQALS